MGPETPYLPGMEPESYDLELMTPAEVSQLHSEHAARYMADTQGPNDMEIKMDAMRKLDALNDGIATLPWRNIEKAREMYFTLGNSKIMEDRNLVALHMHQLVRREEGGKHLGEAIVLWIELLRDPDSEVHDGARMSALTAVKGNLLTPTTLSAVMGRLATWVGSERFYASERR